jgi:hypothetical protein
MKATELRIGNFVEFENEVFRMHIISESYPVLDTDLFGAYVVEWDKLYPIPLTEEWLADFGFIDKYKSCNNDWSIYGFTINQQSDEDDDGNKIPQEQIFYYQYQYDIKYVHQLQNLYFALTGKELTINQEKHEIKSN